MTPTDIPAFTGTNTSEIAEALTIFVVLYGNTTISHDALVAALNDAYQAGVDAGIDQAHRELKSNG